jgi:serine/threonine protein kinase
LFDAAGHLILADFGIARRLEKQSTVMSETANLQQLDQEPLSFGSSTRDCGTPLFMSPEQHKGDSYSFEVDYWALGVILYRMLTGKVSTQKTLPFPLTRSSF